MRWVKSSRSQPGGNCVEARAARNMLVRDSKMGDASPILSASRADWDSLLRAVRG